MLWSDWPGMDDNWDLEAVVRGCCSAAGAEHPSSSAAGGGDGAAGAGADPLTFLANWEPLLLGEDDMDKQSFNFPDLLATETAMQELEELCKPFFHKDEAATQSPQPAISAPTAAPPQARPQRASQSQIPRSKRRKNQLKKVVCQVPAEGLSSDMWAWRKYGQKPIKGSPYPRGYYRCSSSKGCLARKQVERSCSDPSMFIITYTSEHNHPVPTHRNSLAGSTRQKYSSSATAQQQPASAEAAVSPTLSAGLSPATPLTATSAEEEDNHQHKQEEESSIRGEEVDQEEYNQDDMFIDLGELRSPPEDSPGGVLDSWFSESSPVGFPAPWLANSNTAAAAGGR